MNAGTYIDTALKPFWSTVIRNCCCVESTKGIGMGDIVVTAARTIAALPPAVYQVFANYKDHHPKVLPPAFSDFKVEEGGIGAGTRFSYLLTAGRRRRAYTMRVTEPDPGHILKESDERSSLTTTFTVIPEGGGSRVVIETRWQNSPGFGGLMERLFAPRVLHQLYVEELARVDRYVQNTPIS